MKPVYEVYGCDKCRKLFYTRAQLVARCPYCAHQLLLYNNGYIKFGVFQTKQEAQEFVDRKNKRM